MARQPRKEAVHEHQLAEHADLRSARAVQYFCLYQTARLTYSATLISTP